MLIQSFVGRPRPILFKNNCSTAELNVAGRFNQEVPDIRLNSCLSYSEYIPTTSSP